MAMQKTGVDAMRSKCEGVGIPEVDYASGLISLRVQSSARGQRSRREWERT